MNCNNCGSPLIPGDQFCKNCGTPVPNNSVQNPNVGVNGPVIQPTMQPVQPEPQQVFQQPVQTVETMNMSQPMNNVSTPTMQPQNVNPTPSPVQPQPTNKNNTVLFVIIGVVLVGIIIVLAVLLMNKKEQPVTNGTNGNTSGDNVAQLAQTNTYEVTGIGYKFDVPTDIVYEKDSEQIMFGNEAKGWVAMVSLFDSYYSEISSNSTLFAQTMNDLGYSISNTEVKTIGNKEYVVFDGEYEGMVYTMAFTELPNNNTAMIMIIDMNNVSTNQYLEDVNKILETAEYAGSYRGIEFNAEFPSLDGAFNNITSPETQPEVTPENDPTNVTE